MNDHSDTRPGRDGPASLRRRLGRPLESLADRIRALPTPVAAGGLALFTFVAGIHAATLSESVDARTRSLRAELRQERHRVQQLEGRLEGLRAETDRLGAIHRYSATYSIGTDLAALIHDVALEEGLEPALAFQLVSVESSFRRHVESHKGAVGYTQIKPSTARWIDPSVAEADLFDPETNLRLGFRYLKLLLGRFDGDLRLALLAYNQGPGRVGAKLAMGRDPANGYARSVLSTLQ